MNREVDSDGNKKYYRYRAGAFSGVRSFSGVATGGTRVCSIYACTGDSRSTCGSRFTNYVENTTAIFEELTIVGTIPTPVVVPELEADDSIVYPVSSTVSIMPLEVTEYSYSSIKTDNVTVHTLTLNNHTAELYTLALWGREFWTDGQVEDPPLEDDDEIPEGSPEVPETSTVVLPDSTPDTTPGLTAGSTPDATPDSTPASTLDSTPDSAPDSTPDSTPDSSVVHLLSRVLLASVVGLIFCSQF